MTTRIKKTLFPIAMLLLILPLLQGCSDDDNVSPDAHHVKVKVTQKGCGWTTLAILNPRYAKMGEENFCWRGECGAAVRVDDKENPAFIQKLEMDKVYYVDMERSNAPPFYLCGLAPGPQVSVIIHKVH